MKKLFISLMLILLILPFVSASVTCNPPSISVTCDSGTIPASVIMTCSNNANQSVTFSQIGNYFSTSPSTPLLFSAFENKTITVTFQSAPAGIYSGTLYFSDGSSPIPVTINVNQAQQSETCNSIDIFPQIFSNIKIVQNSQKVRNVMITVPQCSASWVDLRGIILATEEKPITLGEFTGGKIQPGQSVQIPIEIDSTDVSTGAYQDTLSFSIYNASGIKLNVPSVSVSVSVTSSISAVSNFSDFSQLPSCSVDASDLSLNSTYRLICSLPNPNFDISPQIDDAFIKGISVSTSNNQYTYYLSPIKIGNTNIGANFLYKNAKIGTPFSQSVRISYLGSSPLSGTVLVLNFYENGYKKNFDALSPGQVNALVFDSLSNSTVNPHTLYLNGQVVNDSFTVSAGSNYELIASANGYVSTILNLKVQEVALGFSLEPFKDNYDTGEVINLTTTPEGGSFLLDNAVVTSPLTLTEGTHVIRAVKEGYIEANKTITVKTIINILTMSDDFDKWGNGKTIVMKLSKNATWTVTRDDVQLATGDGDIVKFKIDKLVGNFKIASKDNVILEHAFTKKTFGDFIKSIPWYGWVILGVLLIFVIYMIFFKDSSPEASSSSGEGFFNPGGG